MTEIYPVKVRMKRHSKKSYSSNRNKSDLTVITIPKILVDKYHIQKGDLLLMVDRDNQLSIHQPLK